MTASALEGFSLSGPLVGGLLEVKAVRLAALSPSAELAAFIRALPLTEQKGLAMLVSTSLMDIPWM